MIQFYLSNKKTKHEFNITGKNVSGFVISKNGDGPILNEIVLVSIIDEAGKEYQFKDFINHTSNYGIEKAMKFVVRKNPELVWNGDVPFEISFQDKNGDVSL